MFFSLKRGNWDDFFVLRSEIIFILELSRYFGFEKLLITDRFEENCLLLLYENDIQIVIPSSLYLSLPFCSGRDQCCLREFLMTGHKTITVILSLCNLSHFELLF